MEMQAARSEHIEKRTRYYHSEVDAEMLEAGMSYRDLPASYVIFLCDYDPFDRGLYRYTFRQYCRKADVILQDDSISVFLNTHGMNDGEEPEWLTNFLHYVQTEPATPDSLPVDAFLHKVQRRVKHVKEERKWEVNYMLLQELIDDERRDAWEEGRSKGLAEGHSKGLAEGHSKGLAEGHSKGLAEGHSLFIIEILEEHGILPGDLRERILAETDPGTLNQYMKLAVQCNSIEDFTTKVSAAGTV